MTRNKNSTRYYSGKQERSVAKAVNGRTTPNSGAPNFTAGDVVADDWLFECKTKTESSQSMSVKKEWIEKNKEEAFQMGKRYSAVVIDFGDGHNYYIVDERTFLEMKGALDEQHEDKDG